uniref:P-type domain-containing protein n=1 Tax=Ascaris lumbricoides TaxID=6252 RepID=A0A0M3HPG6_ASCLU
MLNDRQCLKLQALHEIRFSAKMLRTFMLILLINTIIKSQNTPNSRIDCHPEPYPERSECENRGCIWSSQEPTIIGEPQCYFFNTTGYVMSSDGTTLIAAEHSKNPFYPNLSPINFKYEYFGKTLNVKIYSDGRYDPPIELPRMASTSEDSLNIRIGETGPQGTFGFVVARDSTGTKIWDTSIGGLLFGDQYIQIATYLPTKNIFGFGEHVHKKIKHNMDRYTTWPMYAHSILPDSYAALSTRNLYGVHPFYLGVEEGGKTHGVLILNSNIQEVTLGPGPHLIYRTLGGNLDIYYFPGPTPEEVVQQYQTLVGPPSMPAYWAFGFQLGRRGYANLDDMIDRVNSTLESGVPLETVVADIEYMEDSKVFTLNARFVEWSNRELVDDLNKLYVLTNGTLLMLSNAWPKNNVATPDFMDPSGNTENWWINEFELFHQQVAFDSVWIDMNEPTSFFVEPTEGPNSEIEWNHLKCPTNATEKNYDYPNYATWASFMYDEELFTDTNCLLGTMAAGKHTLYDTRNLYGLWMTMHTRKAHDQVLKKRGAMISRSTFPSSGRYSGHFLGQNSALWEDLQTSIVGMMEFNIFGIPFVGADICGYSANTNKELCVRWHQLGAFYPLSRNYNGPYNTDHHPSYWSEVESAAKQSLLFKYYYMPYLYTLFYLASRDGGTVVRPLFFEFPTDTATYDTSFQFMWGPGMLIAPVILKGYETVDAYLPPSATWYSLREKDYGTVMEKTSSTTQFSAGWNEVAPVFARGQHFTISVKQASDVIGGVIIPRQMPAQILKDARKHSFELLIPLEVNDELMANEANGSLYWDDGESLIDDDYFFLTFTFSIDEYFATLAITPIHTGMVNLPKLDVIEIFGYPYYPDFSTTTLNGVSIRVNETTYSPEKKMLRMQDTNMIDWSAPHTLQMVWEHSRTATPVSNPPSSTADVITSATPTTETTTSSTIEKETTVATPLTAETTFTETTWTTASTALTSHSTSGEKETTIATSLTAETTYTETTWTTASTPLTSHSTSGEKETTSTSSLTPTATNSTEHSSTEAQVASTERSTTTQSAAVTESESPATEQNSVTTVDAANTTTAAVTRQGTMSSNSTTVKSTVTVGPDMTTGTIATVVTTSTSSRSNLALALSFSVLVFHSIILSLQSG